jgi:outer membrane protein OmpA-like peptidoglycan-associated protein
MLKTLLAAILSAFVLKACETQSVTAAAAPKPPQQPRTFMVFFDFDRATLTPRALDIVREAANAAKANRTARIICTGHTDTAGAQAYNMALSLRRASAVKEALVRDGVPGASIDVLGRGEDALLVATGNATREPQNRRVEILLQ